jgi:hypothetical protein
MGREIWTGLIDWGEQAHLYDTDDRFFPGWKLDTSWVLCTVSWSVMILLAGIISSAAIFLPPEGGYELIPEQL